jgi:hypothetical protein
LPICTPGYQVVELQAELGHARTAHEDDAAVLHEVGKDFARHALHRWFLLLLAAFCRKLDRIEVEEDHDRVALLQRRMSEVQAHPPAPGIAARHVEEQRVLLRCTVCKRVGVMGLASGNRKSQNQTGQKATK